MLMQLNIVNVHCLLNERLYLYPDSCLQWYHAEYQEDLRLIHYQ